jgi:hypothetical protein
MVRLMFTSTCGNEVDDLQLAQALRLKTCQENIRRLDHWKIYQNSPRQLIE